MGLNSSVLSILHLKLHHPSFLIFLRVFSDTIGFCCPCMLENSRSAGLLMFPKIILEQLGIRDEVKVIASYLAGKESCVASYTIFRGPADLRSHFLWQKYCECTLSLTSWDHITNNLPARKSLWLQCFGGSQN